MLAVNHPLSGGDHRGDDGMVSGIRVGWLLAGLALAGCAVHQPGATVGAGGGYGLPQAAVVDDQPPARPLTPLLTEKVRMVSWNAANADMKPGAAYTFPYPVWLTVDGEVKDFCRGYVAGHHATAADVQARLEQLLGLRPGDGAGRSLITFEVARAQVFRPCPDPAVDTTQCRAVFDRKSLGAALDKDAAATRFLLEQMLFSYVEPNGYPFTRRGYTYDWSPEAAKDGHFGLSEYVTRAATTVTIVGEPQTPAAYCGVTGG